MARKNLPSKVRSRRKREYAMAGLWLDTLGVKMYCEICDQLVEEDMFGRLVHSYQVSDGHYPIVEAS